MSVDRQLVEQLFAAAVAIDDAARSPSLSKAVTAVKILACLRRCAHSLRPNEDPTKLPTRLVPETVDFHHPEPIGPARLGANTMASRFREGNCTRSRATAVGSTQSLIRRTDRLWSPPDWMEPSNCGVPLSTPQCAQSTARRC
jgi:hypothetical protein